MPKRGHLDQVVIVALLLAAGWGVVAGVRSRSPETELAAPGAPLYEYAVTESVKTLMSKQEQAELGAAGRPPSPGPDHYWCDNCKTYHKRQTPAQQPAVAQRPVSAPVVSPQPGAAAARPPSPGADSYWCENCKTYHKRQTPASAGQPGAAQKPGASPAAPPAQSEDFYYCEKCKTYHRRQPVVQQPATDAKLIYGGVTNNPNWSPLIVPGGTKR